MTYVIASPCVDVMDTACVDVCPVDCIYYDKGEDRMLFIHPEECIDCAACEPVCPVAAIFSQDAVPAQEGAYTEVNALWFKDKAAARKRVNELKAPGSQPATPKAH